MEEEVLNTRELILEVAKKEFLEKGFKNASLRNICKTAGVSTGAVYGYFKDKDSIFTALVSDAMYGIKELINKIEGEEAGSNIADLFGTRKDIENLVIMHNEYIDYIYDNFEEFKLLIVCSGGSSVETFIEDLAKYIGSIDILRIDILKEKGIFIDDFVIHMIVKFYITSICELVEHNIPREDAVKYISTLSTFFFAGWAELLKKANLIPEN